MCTSRKWKSIFFFFPLEFEKCSSKFEEKVIVFSRLIDFCIYFVAVFVFKIITVPGFGTTEAEDGEGVCDNNICITNSVEA